MGVIGGQQDSGVAPEYIAAGMNLNRLVLFGPGGLGAADRQNEQNGQDGDGANPAH